MTNMQIALPEGSIKSYISYVNQLPLLSLEEEQMLARRRRDHNDLEASHRLVMSHLRLVVKIACNYSGYGLQLADLIQEGNIGLMKAVKRFDPDVGVRLVSFAIHWIRAAIYEFVLRNWRIVKIATTKAQRKLFFNLRSSKKRLSCLHSREIDGIAKDLGVKPGEVVEMEKRLGNYDVPFENYNDENENNSPAYYLKNEHGAPDKIIEAAELDTERQTALSNAITLLDERSRAIVSKRWLAKDKATLHELAAEYDVSAERIRQIEKNAMKKLRENILTARND